MKIIMVSAIARVRACEEWKKDTKQEGRERMMYPSNYESIGEIRDNFEEVTRAMNEGKESEEGVENQYLIINLQDKCSKRNLLDPYEKTKFESEVNQMQMIELIKTMAERDSTILEVDAIKDIIEFKWQKYTRSFFAVQLILFLIFVISFIVDVVGISRSQF